MAAGVRIERRDAHQAMDAALGLEPAIGVGTADPDRRRFEAGLLAAALFEPLDLVAVRFGPARIHAQQHLGPILRLGAAGPGMNLEIAIVAVGLARQQALELAPGRLGAQLFEARLGLGDDLRLALGLAQFYELERVVDLALDAPIAADRVVEPGTLAQQLLRRGGIVPQQRVLGLGVELGEAPGCAIPVKDASSAAPATF